VLSDGFYKQEKKDSLWFNYAQSGELMSAENYKNDLLNGKALYYYKEGQVLEHKLQVERRVQYLDGKLHGKYQSYFYNGKLKQEGSYERGLKQGLWSEYNSKGVLIGTMKYVNDFLHGWVITYDEAGQVLNKTLYLDGQKLSEKELTIYLSNCKARNIKPVE
jgi:antitoxin component YwqK of YwqJK toxin-antitoxin module